MFQPDREPSSQPLPQPESESSEGIHITESSSNIIHQQGIESAPDYKYFNIYQGRSYREALYIITAFRVFIIIAIFVYLTFYLRIGNSPLIIILITLCLLLEYLSINLKDRAARNILSDKGDRVSIF